MVAPQVKRGTVRVEGFRGMLRLRWSFQGDRYGFSMGVPDTEMNRTVAEGKARVIEGDMGTSNFDKTLAKYRPMTAAVTSVTVIDLFQKFQQHKEKTLYKQSLAKYKALHKPLQDFFKNKAASKVEVPTAENFRDYLCKGLAPVTANYDQCLLGMGY